MTELEIKEKADATREKRRAAMARARAAKKSKPKGEANGLLEKEEVCRQAQAPQAEVADLASYDAVHPGCHEVYARQIEGNKTELQIRRGIAAMLGIQPMLVKPEFINAFNDVRRIYGDNLRRSSLRTVFESQTVGPITTKPNIVPAWASLQFRQVLYVADICETIAYHWALNGQDI